MDGDPPDNPLWGHACCKWQKVQLRCVKIALKIPLLKSLFMVTTIISVVQTVAVNAALFSPGWRSLCLNPSIIRKLYSEKITIIIKKNMQTIVWASAAAENTSLSRHSRSKGFHKKLLWWRKNDINMLCTYHLSFYVYSVWGPSS